MNPLTGRFLSRDPEDGDPADPASLQKYAYADADPVNGIDPTGWSTVAETGDIDTEVALREAPKPKIVPGSGWGTLALLGSEILRIYEAEHVGTSIMIGKNGSPQGVELIGSNCSARATSPSTGPGPGPAPGPGPGPGPKGPPDDPPSQLSRMKIQLQKGSSQSGGITDAGATRTMVAKDPPGVSSLRVSIELTELAVQARIGLRYLPKSQLPGLLKAIDQVNRCVASKVNPAGVSGYIQNLCQGYVTKDKNGWRLDLDNDSGTNLRQ